MCVVPQGSEPELWNTLHGLVRLIRVHGVRLLVSLCFGGGELGQRLYKFVVLVLVFLIFGRDSFSSGDFLICRV